VKPAPFAYLRPGSLTEAVAALAGDPGAKVLAGGQSLVPLLSMRLAAPSLLVDINALPGLDTISADESGVTIGALARHADVVRVLMPPWQADALVDDDTDEHVDTQSALDRATAPPPDPDLGDAEGAVDLPGEAVTA